MFHFCNQVCHYTDNVTTCFTEQDTKLVLVTEMEIIMQPVPTISIKRYG